MLAAKCGKRVVEKFLLHPDGFAVEPESVVRPAERGLQSGPVVRLAGQSGLQIFCRFVETFGHGENGGMVVEGIGDSQRIEARHQVFGRGRRGGILDLGLRAVHAPVVSIETFENQGFCVFLAEIHTILGKVNRVVILFRYKLCVRAGEKRTTWLLWLNKR